MVTHEQNIIGSETHLERVAHEQITTCSELFAGHVVTSWKMERKIKAYRMIMTINSTYLVT